MASSPTRLLPQFRELLTPRDSGRRLIFEIGQRAFDARGRSRRNMGKLADLGFRFSLDKVTDSTSTCRTSPLRREVPKIGAQVLLDELGERGPADAPLPGPQPPRLRALPALRRRRHRREGRDRAPGVDILELNIGFGQGHLFGEPRAIRTLSSPKRSTARRSSTRSPAPGRVRLIKQTAPRRTQMADFTNLERAILEALCDGQFGGGERLRTSSPRRA
jgi:hypothetical protein